MWRSGPLRLHTCPVHEIEPESQAAVAWFLATYTRAEHGWIRVGYPRAGGVEDQDARLMALIDMARQAANAVLREQQMTETQPAQTRTGDRAHG